MNAKPETTTSFMAFVAAKLARIEAHIVHIHMLQTCTLKSRDEAEKMLCAMFSPAAAEDQMRRELENAGIQFPELVPHVTDHADISRHQFCESVQEAVTVYCNRPKQDPEAKAT